MFKIIRFLFWLGVDFRLIESAPETHVTPKGVEQRFLYTRFTRR